MRTSSLLEADLCADPHSLPGRKNHLKIKDPMKRETQNSHWVAKCNSDSAIFQETEVKVHAWAR